MGVPRRSLGVVALATLLLGCAQASLVGASADDPKAHFGRDLDAVALRRPSVWIDLIGIDSPVRPASTPRGGAKYGWIWKRGGRCSVAWFDENWEVVAVERGAFTAMFTDYP